MPSISTSIGLKIKKLRSLFLSKAIQRRIKVTPVALVEPEYEQIDNVRVTLPVLLLRSITKTRFELAGEAVETIYPRINEDVPCTNLKRGVVIAHNDSAYAVGRAIGSFVSGITQLWLESKVDAEFVRGLIDAHVEREATDRFSLVQLTVCCNQTDAQIETMARLILLTRKSLRSIRMRRVLVSNKETASFLWNSIGQCSLLDNVEYEPRRKDRISREFIIGALEGKVLDSLILSSVDDLTVTDLISIASCNGLSQLRVKGSLIHPSSLITENFEKTLKSLDTLLIHIDARFSLYDTIEREALLILLGSLKESAVLEVIHGAPESPREIAKIISYWLHLADETNRIVRLKLEGVDQEIQDSAVGRLMRKVESVHRVEWNPHQFSLQNQSGKVTILDCSSVFGDE